MLHSGYPFVVLSFDFVPKIEMYSIYMRLESLIKN